LLTSTQLASYSHHGHLTSKRFPLRLLCCGKKSSRSLKLKVAPNRQNTSGALETLQAKIVLKIALLFSVNLQTETAKRF